MENRRPAVEGRGAEAFFSEVLAQCPQQRAALRRALRGRRRTDLGMRRTEQCHLQICQIGQDPAEGLDLLSVCFLSKLSPMVLYSVGMTSLLTAVAKVASRLSPSRRSRSCSDGHLIDTSGSFQLLEPQGSVRKSASRLNIDRARRVQSVCSAGRTSRVAFDPRSKRA